MALLFHRIKELTVDYDLRLGEDACFHVQKPVALVISQILNARKHSGKSLLMDKSGAALTFTLPRATGSGRKFMLLVGTVNTSGYIVKSSAGADVMKGSVVMAGATPTSFAAASTSDTVTLNGTTTGGVSVGDFVEFTDLKANVWAVRAVLTFSGTAATPFSDTVA